MVICSHVWPMEYHGTAKKNSAHCTYATMPDCNSAAAPYKFQDGRKNDHPHKTLAQPAWAISRRMYRSSSTLLASTQPITCMAHLLSCWTKTSSWGQVMHGKKKPKKNSTHQQQTTTSSSSTTTTTTMHHQKRGHQKVNSWSAKQHWGLERIGKSSHVVEHHVGVYMRSRSPWGIRC